MPMPPPPPGPMPIVNCATAGALSPSAANSKAKPTSVDEDLRQRKLPEVFWNRMVSPQSRPQASNTLRRCSLPMRHCINSANGVHLGKAGLDGLDVLRRSLLVLYWHFLSQ